MALCCARKQSVWHRVLGEYGTSATNVIAERIWMQPEVEDPGQPFGGDDGAGGYAPLAVVIGTTVRLVHASHLGVPLLHLSTAGAVIATPAYTLPGFPGQLRTFADLYYNRYRDYDPTTGRYIQADPIGLGGGANEYQYVLGNPLGFVDPLGLAGSGWSGQSMTNNGPTIDRYLPKNVRLKVPPEWNSSVDSVNCPKAPPPPPPPPVDWCGSSTNNSEWVPDHIVHVNISGACKAHDKCYGSRSTMSRRQCDSRFGRDIIKQCIRQAGGLLCYAAGPIYQTAVRTRGRAAYEGRGNPE